MHDPIRRNMGRVLPDFVTNSTPDKTLQLSPVVCAPESLSESQALPLEWILGPKTSLAAHVVAYLIVQEAKEVNPHLRDDLRIAQLTVIFLERGDAVECTAFELATYSVLGCHPNRVWPNILARRAAALGTGTEGCGSSYITPQAPLGVSISADSGNEAFAPFAETQLGASSQQICNLQSTSGVEAPVLSKKPVQSIPSSNIQKEEA